MEGFNRRDVLKGLAATSALNILGESAEARGYLDVQRAEDDEKFSLFGFYVYLGFSIKFNEEYSHCPIEPKMFSSSREGDRFHFSVNGIAFAHDFRTEAEKQEEETAINYTEFKSRLVTFLSEQEGVEDCFAMS